MSYSEKDGQVILTPQEALRRATVVSEVDELFRVWRRDTEKRQRSAVTPYQKMNYFRELFVETVWRKWPQ